MTRKEHTEARSARQTNRRFEELVQAVSTTLIESNDPDIDRALESVLAQIGEYLDVDRGNPPAPRANFSNTSEAGDT